MIMWRKVGASSRCDGMVLLASKKNLRMSATCRTISSFNVATIPCPALLSRKTTAHTIQRFHPFDRSRYYATGNDDTDKKKKDKKKKKKKKRKEGDEDEDSGILNVDGLYLTLYDNKLWVSPSDRFLSQYLQMKQGQEEEDLHKFGTEYVYGVDVDDEEGLYREGMKYGEIQRELSKVFLSKAADRGHIAANMELGKLFHREGALSTALPYYQYAAKQGNPEAQYLFGKLLLILRNTETHQEKEKEKENENEKDKEKANENEKDEETEGEEDGYEWIRVAAKGGHPDALIEMERTQQQQQQQGMAPPSSSQEVKEGEGNTDEGEGLMMLRRRAEGGDREAQRCMGDRMAEGGDERKAVGWWRVAGSRGDGVSLYNLGVAHLGGMGGIAANVHIALEYLERAAGLGVVEALDVMASIYGEGLYGIKPNSSLSTLYSQQALDMRTSFPYDDDDDDSSSSKKE